MSSRRCKKPQKGQRMSKKSPHALPHAHRSKHSKSKNRSTLIQTRTSLRQTQSRKPHRCQWQKRSSQQPVLFSHFRGKNCAMQIWPVRPLRQSILHPTTNNNKGKHPQTTPSTKWTGSLEGKSMSRMHVEQHMHPQEGLQTSQPQTNTEDKPTKDRSLEGK